MHPFRLFLLLTIAALTGACGGTSPGTSNVPVQTQAPTVTQPAINPPPGGGGSGANGSITYQITGGLTTSGDSPFLPMGVSVWVPASNGWVATFSRDDGAGYVQLNTQAAGQIFNFSDGTASVVGTSAPGSGSGCTFTLTKNDPSGLAGSVACTNALVTTAAGTVERAAVSAQWNAHP